MDRADACFVASALDSRISGDRGSLDRLAASEFVRLIDTAARVKALAADWVPALYAAAELEKIARQGSDVDDEPCARATLQIFVDKMIELTLEPAARPSNRASRRKAASGRTAARERRANVRALHAGAAVRP